MTDVTLNRTPRIGRVGAAIVLCLALDVGAHPTLGESLNAGSVESESVEDAISRAKAARGGVGLRVGTWSVRDLPSDDGATYSRSPHYEGYFQKGLDSHLVIENTLGLWRWVQDIEEEGGPLTSDSREVVSTYLVPAFSAIKFYPITRPGNRLEPYVKAGAGLILGIENVESSGAALPSLSPGTSASTGFGLNGGVGVDWAFSPAFGLTAGGHYRWLRFGESVGGKRTYQGLGLDLGLTYRFRY